MLRRVLLYLSAAKWARRMVTHWGVARRVARRFVAGETLDDAMKVTKELYDKGLFVTLDYLGESVSTEAETQPVVAMYCMMIDRIQQQKVEASVSLKLTHLGLDISEELCHNNLQTILAAAKERGVPLTIDMESSAYVDKTLRLYRTMRDEYDFDNVGTVIQSYLRRSGDDMHLLAAEGAHIRLVKGAYLEPPEVAFPKKADVDDNYAQLAADYVESAPPAYLCIATHDERMIQSTEQVIKRQAVAPDRYEYQMLYGIRSARQIELAAAGHKMRVYVPFGEAWYPYFMRRLAERPANLWFFARSFFKR